MHYSMKKMICKRINNIYKSIRGTWPTCQSTWLLCIKANI